MQLRPKQISTEDGVPGQLLGITGEGWAPVDPPTGGGGGGLTGPFFDDFERPDAPLAGDNGWIKPLSHLTETATFYIEGGVVKQTAFGAYPILHERGGAEDIADVTLLTGYGTEGGVGFGYWGICFCSDAAGDYGLQFEFDGGGTFYGVNRFAPDGIYGGSMTWTVEDWAGWALGETMKIRCVYTDATQTLEVYQNDVLALSGDVSDEGGGFFFGEELPALSSMGYAGFMSNNDDHSHEFDDFSIDGATEPPAPAGIGVLDDLTDVDTTTTPPEDQQFLKFDNDLGLWVPADLPSSTTGAPFDVTDEPEDPPPYAGYAYLNSEGKVRIWNGTEWRELTTVLYEPPGEGDPDIDLASLIGRYKAPDLSYADGVAVATWTDSSAADNDLVTITAGTMETAGIGGLPSVLFDTFTAYNLPAATGRPCTVVAVMQNTDSGEGSILFSSPGGVAPYLGMLNGVGWRASDGSNVLDVAVGTPLDPHVYYTQFDAGVVNAGLDGGLSTTASVNVVTIQRIGRYEAAPSYSMTGLVSEILVYDAVLTSGELDAIAVSLGTTYGITVTP